MRRLAWPIALTVLTVLSALAVVAAVAYLESRPQPRLSFAPLTLPTLPRLARPRPPAPRPRPPQALSGVAWPTYGYDGARSRSAPFQLRPPYRRRWVAHGRSLIELPPVIGYGRLYFGTNRGLVLAVSTASGRVAWRRQLGRCIASSPALAQGIVYLTYMDPVPCAQHRDALGGGLAAFDAQSGRLLWRRPGAVSESSPLVVGSSLYYGDWSGAVYALDVRHHRLRWRFQTGAKVKGAVAYAAGKVYVGSYDGRLYCLSAKDGRELWATALDGPVYANPAVQAGRVYVGTTAGSFYALGRGGRVLWRAQTAGYVYSSAAVYRGRVYVGSYDGTLYAFDAVSGVVTWRFAAGAAISGSPTVLDGLVYVASLGQETFALDAGSGRRVWSFPDGQYNPLVADRDQAYLVGVARVYALVPRLRARRR